MRRFGFVGRRWFATELWKRGDRVCGFEVVRTERVEEKNLECVELRHMATGARHLHVGCDDSNNTFAVSFLTVPSDSTGVAHILEHTALCGSKKYPVRDPFFNMIKRSLNTFMNAFTGADYTMYPFSSQNAQDFSNLLSVYLDATFHPNLERMDFLQEGHRLEIDEKTGKLTRTGIVFNEMHGALSDASSLFREQLGAALYPDTTYGHNSGGDPVNIPDLTWEGLRAFHARHYHPSNAWFYTYGDMPLTPHLELIDRALQGKEGGGRAPLSVDMQKLSSVPKVLVARGPPSPGPEELADKQHKAAVVWLMPDASTDYQLTLAMTVLSELLVSGPSAPMYRALLETRMGSGYSPMTGYEAYNKQPTFGVGATGMSAEDSERLPQVVTDVLQTCLKEGFPAERIESVLHQLELSNKHVTSSYGLNAGMGAVIPWMHGGDPVDCLRFDKFMTRLRSQIADGYLQELISTRLLGNMHRVIARQEPDEQYSAKLKDAEQKRLAELDEKLSEADKEQIRKDAQLLKERQNAPPNVECLPTLTEADIPVSKPRVVVDTSGRVRFSVQPTNGVVYLNVILDLSDLPDCLMPAVPLFCSLLTSQGAAGKNHRDFSQEIDLVTGGLSLSPSLQCHPDDVSQFQMGVTLHVHCLDRNVSKMLSVLERLLFSADWSDRENMAALLEQSSSGVLETLTRSGHSYAARTAASVFGRQQQLSEMWSGMTQVSYISSLAKDPEAVLDKLLKDFSAIEQHLRIGIRNVRAQVNAAGDAQLVDRSLAKWWNPSVLDSSRFIFVKGGHQQQQQQEQQLFFPVPSQVNFVARAVRTGLSYSHPDSPAVAVGAKVLSSCFLHREIREKGGAYGGGSSLATDGMLSLTSYRDPNLERTLSTFQEGLSRWIFDESSVSDRDVREAKLSLFAGLDQPVPPGSRGLAEFSSGISHEQREERRARLLSVTRRDVKEAFARHVSLRLVSVAALGSDQLELDSTWTRKKV